MGEQTQLDIAIVGAGVSGVYTAWRLATSEQYRTARIAVFELSDRVGGRLLSAQPPGMPDVTVELGGMRFFSTQRYVNALVNNELKLPVVELPADEPENIGFFRGQRYRRWQFDPPACTATSTNPFPYRISGGYQPPPGFRFQPSWEEAEIAPTDLLVYAVLVAVPEYDPYADAATRKAALQAAVIDGRPLAEWGFWNLLARVLSREAYCLMKAVVGYDSTFLNWNAVDSILENLDFSPAVKKYRVTTGYDQVPQQLARRFEDTNGKIFFGQRLRQFESAGAGTAAIRATFEHVGESGAVEQWDVEAKHLVLAMPRTSLEGLRQVGPVLGRREVEVHEMLRTVTPDPLFKIALAYDEPWWHSYGVTQGRSLSDQPIRQCYYWGIEGDVDPAEPKNRNSLLMLYNDAESMDFFGGFMRSTDRYLIRPNRWVKPGDEGSDTWKAHPAPRRLVDAAHRQVVEMHGARAVGEPYAAAAAQWSGAPYGGGANFWNAGVDSDDMIVRVVQPRDGIPVYIVGEAYSGSQSWVEGALETAELVLTEKFGLPDPTWLTGDSS
jgi:monoamine oxidase